MFSSKVDEEGIIQIEIDKNEKWQSDEFAFNSMCGSKIKGKDAMHCGGDGKLHQRVG